jgi:hypothetical protein
MKYDIDAIRQNNELLEVAARYVDVRKEGREWKSLCIFHADGGTPNLTYFRGRDGLWRFRCFACCAGGDVVDFVEQAESIDTKEALRRLAGNELPVTGTYRVPEHRTVDTTDYWECVLPAPAHAPPYDPAKTYNPKAGEWKRYRPKRVDTYRDANGAVLCHVARLEFDDGKKICMTITWCRGPEGEERWCAKRMPPPYPLLGLDDLAAKPKALVFVFEGEKKRELAKPILAQRNIVTCAFMGGVEGLKHADVTPLRGRNLVVWPDADGPGVRAMATLVGMVQRA